MRRLAVLLSGLNVVVSAALGGANNHTVNTVNLVNNTVVNNSVDSQRLQTDLARKIWRPKGIEVPLEENKSNLFLGKAHKLAIDGVVMMEVPVVVVEPSSSSGLLSREGKGIWSIEVISGQKSVASCDGDCSECYKTNIYEVNDFISDDIISQTQLTKLSNEVFDIRTDRMITFLVEEPIILLRKNLTLAIVPVTSNQQCRFNNPIYMNLMAENNNKKTTNKKTTNEENNDNDKEEEDLANDDREDLENDENADKQVPKLAPEFKVTFNAKYDTKECAVKCDDKKSITELDTCFQGRKALECSVNYVTAKFKNAGIVIGEEVKLSGDKTAQVVPIFRIPTKKLNNHPPFAQWSIHSIDFKGDFTGNCDGEFKFKKVTRKQNVITSLEDLAAGHFEWDLHRNIVFSPTGSSEEDSSKIGIPIDLSNGLMEIALKNNNDTCTFTTDPAAVPTIEIRSNSYTYVTPEYKVWDKITYNSWVPSYTITPDPLACLIPSDNCVSTKFDTFAAAQSCFSQLHPTNDAKPCKVQLQNHVTVQNHDTRTPVLFNAFTYDGKQYPAFNLGNYGKKDSKVPDVHILEPIGGVQFHVKDIQFVTAAHPTGACNSVRIATMPLQLSQLLNAENKPVIVDRPVYLPKQPTSALITPPNKFTFTEGQFDPAKSGIDKLFMAIPQTLDTCTWPTNSTKPSLTLTGEVIIEKTLKPADDKVSYRLEHSPSCIIKAECAGVLLEQNLLTCLEAARAYLCTIRIVKTLQSDQLTGVLSGDKQMLYPSVKLRSNIGTLTLGTKPQPNIIPLKLRKVDFNNKFSKAICNYAMLQVEPKPTDATPTPFILPNPATIMDASKFTTIDTISAIPARPNMACVWPLHATTATVELVSDAKEYYSLTSLGFKQDLWQKSYFIESSCKQACSSVVHSSIESVEKCLGELLGTGCASTVTAQVTIKEGTGFSGVKYQPDKISITVPILRLNQLYEKIHQHPLKLKSVMFGAQFKYNGDLNLRECNDVDIVPLKESKDIGDQLLITDLDFDHKLTSRLPLPVVFNPPREGLNELVAIPRAKKLKCIWDIQSTIPTIILTTDKIQP